MLKAHFDELAAYNRWANRRIYTDAASLPDEVRKRGAGLFFGSIHGTLNHLLVADYIWMRRFTGDGPQPERLNQILYEDFAELRAAREQEDERIFSFVTASDDYERVIRVSELDRENVPPDARFGVDAFLQSSGASSGAGACRADDRGDLGACSTGFAGSAASRVVRAGGGVPAGPVGRRRTAALSRSEGRIRNEAFMDILLVLLRYSGAFSLSRSITASSTPDTTKVTWMPTLQPSSRSLRCSIFMKLSST